MTTRVASFRWTSNGPITTLDRSAFDPADFKLVASLGYDSLLEQQYRLHEIEDLVLKYPRSPFFLATLAQLYEHLHDPHGALQLAQKAQVIIGQGADLFLEQWIEVLQGRRERTEAETMIYDMPRLKDKRSRPVQPIGDYTITLSSFPTGLVSEWADLQALLGTERRAERFARLLCVGTNELEDVFHLGANSVSNVIRAGFCQAAIQHSSDSAILDDSRIIQILWDTQQALNLVGNMRMDPQWALETRDFLNVHRQLMRSDRIRPSRTGYTHIPTGSWRRQAVWVNRGGFRLLFHPPAEVPTSMDRMIEIARPALLLLKRDPRAYAVEQVYRLAAWLHHALICIHPFLDGNGRMTRFMASLPLLLADLPPICIMLEDKPIYMDALHKADDGDLGPLVLALAIGSLSAIRKVKNLGASEDVEMVAGDGDGHTMYYT
ncbi:hypothetical protein T439DRAFT_328202 [Meredithblackwellia eburnea MCA 4105]